MKLSKIEKFQIDVLVNFSEFSDGKTVHILRNDFPACGLKYQHVSFCELNVATFTSFCILYKKIRNIIVILANYNTRKLFSKLALLFHSAHRALCVCVCMLLFSRWPYSWRLVENTPFVCKKSEAAVRNSMGETRR